jgi:ABC-type polysaccharide/polyol phosphate export permease
MSAVTPSVETPADIPATAAKQGLAERLRRSSHLLMALARSDLHIRYGRGGAQIVHWFLDPFALVGVYLLLRLILNKGGGAAGLSLACAVVPFQIVLSSCTGAMNAVSLREPILLNMRFDSLLIPASSVLTESVAFATSFTMFPIGMIIYGVEPTIALLWLPVIVAATLVLAFGAAWPAALLGLWFPTLTTFATQAIRILFFASPGLVALTEMSDDVRRYIVLNPFTGLFEAYRHVFLYGNSPAFWQLTYPVGAGVLLALVFFPVYRREQRHFAKLVSSA